MWLQDNAPPKVAFWDNDSLAALLAMELSADLLILLTDVGGLYTGPPDNPSSEIISSYCPDVHDPLIKFGQKSGGGRGGMVAKVGFQAAALAVNMDRPDWGLDTSLRHIARWQRWPMLLLKFESACLQLRLYLLDAMTRTTACQAAATSLDLR